MRLRAFLSIFSLLTLFFLFSCKGEKNINPTDNTANTDSVNIPQFCADSAMLSIETQCAFGPRTLGSKAHEDCAAYIIEAFEAQNLDVTRQEADFTLYNGERFRGCNIIAAYKPELTERILICAHWDSRPWADNDPDPANHHTPVLAANDGASGIAVMLEIARLLKAQNPEVGVDFICFDAEDAGVPEWETNFNGNEQLTWCLGSQHWANNPHRTDFRFGILLDMVGAKDAKFYKELFSQRYASGVIAHVWNAAREAGYSSVFVDEDGGGITDDHLPLNSIAQIPTIDIIPYFPHMEHSFGATWHTVSDTPANIDPNTLKAVGQTLLHVIYHF